MWTHKYIAGVAGWPIHHSLSPLMHRSWIKAAGLNADYVPFMVNPDTAIRDFKTLPRSGLSGLNVTLPLKLSALKAADKVTDAAEKIGASNCLFIRGGKLIADNTDAEGFLYGLPDTVKEAVKSRPVLVLGAGGASRAVLHALGILGAAQIILTNRTHTSAKALRKDFSDQNIETLKWKYRSEFSGAPVLLINTTAAGMTGKPALEMSLKAAPEDMFVYDLVYTPLKSRLIKTAQKRGLDYTGGLDMLIGQARPSFEHFFGASVPETVNISRILKHELKARK